MRPMIYILLGFACVLIIPILWFTVSYCTDEQLKWIPLIMVFTTVLIIILGLIGAILQDIENDKDKPESIFDKALDAGSLWVPFM